MQSPLYLLRISICENTPKYVACDIGSKSGEVRLLLSIGRITFRQESKRRFVRSNGREEQETFIHTYKHWDVVEDEDFNA